MKKMPILFLFILFLIFINIPLHPAEKAALHNLGKFVFKDNTYLYPNGFYNSQIFRTPYRDWVVLPVILKPYTNEVGKTEPVAKVRGAFLDPPERQVYLKEIRRWAPPIVTVDGVTVSMAYYGEVDNSLLPDILTEKLIEGIMRIKQKTYSFSNRNYNNFVIHDVIVAFQGNIDAVEGQDLPDQTVEMAWANFVLFYLPQIAKDRLRYSAETRDGWATWDLYTKVMGKPLLVSNKPRNDLKISYRYGYDEKSTVAPWGYVSTEVSNKYDEFGVPDVEKGTSRKGMFLAPSYDGFTTLYADASVNNKSDDINLPRNTGWIQINDDYGQKMARRWLLGSFNQRSL